MPRVLHVPYTYSPDPIGGTEVYVGGLARRLNGLGYEAIIAAPSAEDQTYLHDGIQVHRFAVDPHAGLEEAYGRWDEEAAYSFAALLKSLRPDLVHLHARTAAISDRLLELAREAGAKTVVTYHSPTMSCVRGTMMLWGEGPCDGLLLRNRCTACKAQQLGAGRLGGQILSVLPDSLSIPAFLPPPVRLPGLISASHTRFRNFMEQADQIVAVCQWVADVSAINGVPAKKISLCRQGLEAAVALPATPSSEGPLRFAYFGKLDPVKGIDRLVGALALAPKADLRLDIYGVGQNEAFERSVRRTAAPDVRIDFKPPIPAMTVAQTMQNYDAILVPSLWLETGPLVVLEAFAAGRPVIGADRGGISELVRHGVDGLLVQGDAPQDWASALLGVTRQTLAGLAAGVRPPRSMDEVAAETAALYRRLI